MEQSADRQAGDGGSGSRVLAVGGSAGGVEALQRFVAELPADLPATVLVALHLGVSSPGLLADILSRSTALPVAPAEDGAPLVPGTVVVARPDAHLLLEGTTVRLGRGPRENHHRPSIDVLLRSVALSHGPAAVGVVLTGMLDDGAAGLRRLAQHGGAALVQSPDDAQFPSMPSAALRATPGATALPLVELAREAVRLLRSPAPGARAADEHLVLHDRAELQSAVGRPVELPGGGQPGEPSPFSCPDCGGVLRLVEESEVTRFRCRTGHAYNGETLLQGQTETVEEALYTAMRALEERAELSTRLGEDAGRTGRTYSQSHFRERAEEARRSAAVLRGLLVEHRADGGEETVARQVAT